jgi:pyridoxamine 5'-phosphate oxidase
MSHDADSDEDPFAQLVRTHRDIEARVAELERAAAELPHEERRGAALEAIADVLSYFEGPGAIHHAHEEQTLFPLLRPLEAFGQMLAAFDMQHEMNDAAYAKLRAVLTDFAPAAAPQALSLARRFADLQRAHIIAEERALFPMAARMLSPAAIADMRRAMAARRDT